LKAIQSQKLHFMKKRNLILFTSVTALILFSSFMVLYPGGSPAGYTGSPGDGNDCSNCHNNNPTTATGWITSTIPVAGYIAGQTYQITATNNITGSGKYGFEISPQNASGALLGTMTAGSNSHLVGSGNKYITQSSASSSIKTWTFSWTAPVAGTGQVTFYGAFARNFSGPTTICNLTVSEQTGSLPGAAGPISGPSTVCKNTNGSFSVGTITGATSYVWSVPSGATVTSGQGTTSIVANFGSSSVSGNVSVHGSNATGNGAASNLALNVNSVPSKPGTIGGPDMVDLATVVTSDYTTAGSTSAISYLWELNPAGAGSINGTGLTSTVTWNGSFLGVAEVRVKATNDCGDGVWSEAIITEVINTTGIENIRAESGIKVYPSPCRGAFTVDLKGIKGQHKFRILDITGSQIYSADLPGEEATLIEFPLGPGIYMLLINNGAQILRQKMVIQ
jgi:hypothetical protein